MYLLIFKDQPDVDNCSDMSYRKSITVFQLSRQRIFLNEAISVSRNQYTAYCGQKRMAKNAVSSTMYPNALNKY
ncbi:hypothetical protein HBA_0565 [Sodalis endosymbiont of Henestaris halophilus]|nr:hypothetical protein HBA_0565 [Sodalis endosymbiont of Henestaris halophilus]